MEILSSGITILYSQYKVKPNGKLGTTNATMRVKFPTSILMRT
jgi:hypothetical protein